MQIRRGNAGPLTLPKAARRIAKAFEKRGPWPPFAAGASDGAFEAGAYDAVTLTNAIPGGVPEPASWALMIAGFGLVGAAARRRKPVAC